MCVLCMCIAEKQYVAEKAGMITGIVLAVVIPFMILAFCCCRRHRRNHKKGLENKTLKALTTSRHSLNEPSTPTFPMNTDKTNTSSINTRQEPNWSNKQESSSSPTSSGFGSVTNSELVRSSPPDQDGKSNPSTGSTFDRDSSRSPVASSSSAGSKASPTDSQSSSSQASGGVPSTGSNGQKTGRARYDGVYRTHEPIRGAPDVEFQNTIMDVEINHRNTEV